MQGEAPDLVRQGILDSYGKSQAGGEAPDLVRQGILVLLPTGVRVPVELLHPVVPVGAVPLLGTFNFPIFADFYRFF